MYVNPQSRKNNPLPNLGTGPNPKFLRGFLKLAHLQNLSLFLPQEYAKLPITSPFQNTKKITKSLNDFSFL